jgi:hypothetical protein
MPYDLITEEIAHFIGSLLQDTEEARLRSDHDGFNRGDEAYADPGKLLTVNINVSAPYELAGSTSGIGYSFTPLPMPEPFQLQSVFLDTHQGTHENVALGLGFSAPAAGGAGAAASGSGAASLSFTAPPPSSIATVIHQQNMLDDSDTLLGLSGVEYLNPAAQTLALEWLVGAAESLSGPASLEMPQSSEEDGFTIHEVSLQATGSGAETMGGATVSTMTGDQIYGTYADGVAIDDAPSVDDALPVLPERGDEQAPPHVVVTGGDTVINQAYLNIAATDAPVIAVMGDSLSLTSISQVNVISNIDTINGIVVQPGMNHDMVTNISTVENLSSSPQLENVDANASADDPIFPSFAAVVRIEGDVINMNHLSQYNFVVDNNIVSMEFSADATFIESGGNFVMNLISLTQLTYMYDMIVVAGDIINYTMVNQSNVLLDDDFITYSSDASLEFSGDQNVMWNQVGIHSIGQDSALDMPSMLVAFGESLASGSNGVSGDILSMNAFEGSELISILYIEGDLINYQSINQINIVSNSDQLTLPTPETAGANGADISVTAGSNSLVNIASISEFGVDSDVYVQGETYSDALMYQAGLIVTDESSLVGEDGGGLVTEAVAFLADNPDFQPGESGDEHALPVISEGMGSDPLGGMLT